MGSAVLLGRLRVAGRMEIELHLPGGNAPKVGKALSGRSAGNLRSGPVGVP
jgi:hypothetical protein